MKVVILAGGRGSRFGEETKHRPKPLVSVGERPILWHVLMFYAVAGYRDFIVATGYCGDMVREYLTALAAGPPEGPVDPGSLHIEVVDTGVSTPTGGRLRRIEPLLGRERFMLTWADGLADVNIRALEEFHAGHGRLATVTAAHPPPRFGRLALEGDRVVHYAEKPPNRFEWISGGFFVLEPRVLDYIASDETDWEREPLERLAADGQLMAFRHEGFWQCMDVASERDHLDRLWRQGAAPWKKW
ncbi:MAG: sugar phosphate nucleotidyltransferase [Arenicellales bacterium]